jgi:hypothetical protein
MEWLIMVLFWIFGEEEISYEDDTDDGDMCIYDNERY